MQGRIENEKRTEQKIVEKLKNQPEYMFDYMKTFARKSYTTKSVYINYVLEFINFLKREYNYNIQDIHVFANVKPSTINSYLDYLGKIEKVTKNGKVITNGNSIQCRKFYAIKNFFQFLLNDDYIAKNPCDNVEPPQVDANPNIVAMDKKEINIFLNNILKGSGTSRAKARQSKWTQRDYAIMALALSLGLRVTSLSEINLVDIDLEHNEIMVTEKGNRTRTLRFSESIRQTLTEWIDIREEILDKADCDALFISNQKKRLCPKSIDLLVTKYSQGIDKHITAHKLRSTCATNIYNATGDIYLTADVLGHRNIQNTKRYAKIADERREKAMKAMDKVIFG